MSENEILEITPKKVEWLNKLHELSYYDNQPRTLSQLQQAIFQKRDGYTQKTLQQLKQQQIIKYKETKTHELTHRPEDLYIIDRELFWTKFIENPTIKTIMTMIDKEGIIFPQFKSTTAEFVNKIFHKKQELSKKNIPLITQL